MEVLASTSPWASAGVSRARLQRRRLAPARVGPSCSPARAVRTQFQPELPARGLGMSGMLCAPAARHQRRRDTAARAVIKDDEDTGADLASSEKKPAMGDTKGLIAWILGAAVFGAGLGAFEGPQAAQEFFAGYLVEQSLSVDNLFVFILMFSYFKVPTELEPRVLNYGIYGAAVLRAIFILLGAKLLEEFRPVLLLFAGLLVYSSYKVLFGEDEDDEEEDLEQNPVVKLARKLVKVSSSYDGNKFFTEVDGVKMATPLLLVLVVIELSDLVFAIDSIPAVFGVTQDPFIVYTSNMFAILTLRSLFTVVAGAMTELEYLEKAVGFVLGFIGAKMILDFGGVHIDTGVSLGVVAASLSLGVGLSLANKTEKNREEL